MKRTFEYRDAGAHKFWNVELQGTAVTVTLGPHGGQGKQTTQSYATPEQAESIVEKLVDQKIQTGYRETTRDTSEEGIRREKMEDAIRRDPDNVQLYLELADHLQAQGDPQGEFIHVQLRLEDNSLSEEERNSLRARENELIETHLEEWAGEWVSQCPRREYHKAGQIPLPSPKPIRFRRGFPTDASIEKLTFSVAVAFRDSPQTKHIQRLYIGASVDEEYTLERDVLRQAGVPNDIDEEYSLYVLLNWPYLENLRTFQFGWNVKEDYGDYCTYNCNEWGDKLYRLIKQMPNLEEMYLFAYCRKQMDHILTMDLPKLRVLQLYHTKAELPLAQLAKNRSMTNLTHLLCHPHSLYITKFYDIRALLSSRNLPSLTHLRLRLAMLGDEGCEEIVRSGILERLKVLDLRHGCIGDRGALALAASPALQNLESLDVSRNQLTEEGIDALIMTGVPVNVDLQYDPEEPEEGEFASWMYDGIDSDSYDNYDSYDE